MSSRPRARSRRTAWGDESQCLAITAYSFPAAPPGVLSRSTTISITAKLPTMKVHQTVPMESHGIAGDKPHAASCPTLATE